MPGLVIRWLQTVVQEAVSTSVGVRRALTRPLVAREAEVASRLILRCLVLMKANVPGKQLATRE